MKKKTTIDNVKLAEYWHETVCTCQGKGECSVTPYQGFDIREVTICPTCHHEASEVIHRNFVDFINDFLASE